MVHITRRTTGFCVTEDIKCLKHKLSDFDDLYQLYLLCNIVQLQYVGTGTYGSYRILHNIYLALSSLKIESKIIERLVSLTPNDLCKDFNELLPILSPDAKI